MFKEKVALWLNGIGTHIQAFVPCLHWNEKVPILIKFSSLAILEVVKMTAKFLQNGDIFILVLLQELHIYGIGWLDNRLKL